MAFIGWKMCEKYTVDESLKFWLVDLDITSNVTSNKKLVLQEAFEYVPKNSV